MKPAYRRWYEHDPLLLEVVELLKNYQDELRAQAEVFLKKIEEKVSKEAIDKFYAMVKGNSLKNSELKINDLTTMVNNLIENVK